MYEARIKPSIVRVAALALAFALGLGFASVGHADEVDDAINSAGQDAYNEYCTPCHGPGGAPGTAVSRSTGKPIDLRTYVADNGGRFPAGAWLNAITNPNPGGTHTAVWEQIRRGQGSRSNLSASRGVVGQIARYIISVQQAPEAAK